MLIPFLNHARYTLRVNQDKYPISHQYTISCKPRLQMPISNRLDPTKLVTTSLTTSMADQPFD